MATRKVARKGGKKTRRAMKGGQCMKGGQNKMMGERDKEGEQLHTLNLSFHGQMFAQFRCC
jgi:hypothetical protein